MPYIRNIPQAHHTLTEDQPLIRDNFYQINEFLSVDHFELDHAETAQIGKHHVARITELGQKPDTIATNVAIYNNYSNISDQEELFFAPSSNSQPWEFTSSVNDDFGFTRLPSGIAYKWGIGNANAGGYSHIDLRRPDMPNFFLSHAALVTPVLDGGGLGNGELVVDGYSAELLRVLNRYTVAVQFYYLAIGT